MSVTTATTAAGRHQLAGGGIKPTKTPRQFITELENEDRPRSLWLLEQLERIKGYLDKKTVHEDVDWLNEKEEELEKALEPSPGCRFELQYDVEFVVNLNRWLKSELRTKKDMSWALMLYALNQAVLPSGELDTECFEMVTCSMTITENSASMKKGNAKAFPKALDCMKASRAEIIRRGRKRVRPSEEQLQEQDDAPGGGELAPAQDSAVEEPVAKNAEGPSASDPLVVSGGLGNGPSWAQSFGATKLPSTNPNIEGLRKTNKEIEALRNEFAAKLQEEKLNPIAGIRCESKDEVVEYAAEISNIGKQVRKVFRCTGWDKKKEKVCGLPSTLVESGGRFRWQHGYADTEHHYAPRPHGGKTVVPDAKMVDPDPGKRF